MSASQNFLNKLDMFLPPYLSSETNEGLLKALKEFPENIFDSNIFYADQYHLDPEIIYQGDGLQDFILVNSVTLENKEGPALIFSNTCDISLDNKRYLPMNIIYAPIIDCERYIEILKNSGISEDKIKNHLEQVKKERITQIFYLPKCKKMPFEGIVFLDKITSYPNTKISRINLTERKLFSLSQYGHYLFLFKLSVHFTRMMDGVDRGVRF